MSRLNGRRALRRIALVTWMAAVLGMLPAGAQEESLSGAAAPTPTPTTTPASSVTSVTPAVEIPPPVARLLDRYAQAIADEDLGAFKSCFWQPDDYVLRLQEVLRHFFNVRLRYLQMEAYPGKAPEQLTLKVQMQTRFREERTKKPGQYDQRVEFRLDRRRGEWRIGSIPDPRSRT